MTGHLSARRSVRALTLFAVAGLTAAGWRARDGPRVPSHLPMVASAARPLPQDELDGLAKVAEWLEQPAGARGGGGGGGGRAPGGARVGGERLLAEIREAREGFAVFAGFHTAGERRQALVNVPYGAEIAAAAKEHDVDSLVGGSVVEGGARLLRA